MKKKSIQSKGVKAKLESGFLFAGDVLTNKAQRYCELVLGNMNKYNRIQHKKLKID